MTIHVPYSTVLHSPGDPALSDEWNDISTAVARIEAAQQPVTCSLYQTGTIAISTEGGGGGQWDATRYYAHFNTVEKDLPGGMQNVAGGATGHADQMITIQQAGLYLLFGMTSFAANTSGTYRGISIDKNAQVTQPLCLYQLPNAGANIPIFMTVSGIAYLNAGDFLALRLAQNTGGNVNTQGIGGISAKMSVARLSS